MAVKKSLLIGLIFCGLFLFVSCGDDNPAATSTEPPQIPPVRSMKMDISLFQPFDASLKADMAADSSNFQQALDRAFFLKFIVDAQLLLPRLLLDLASQTKPEFKGGKWVWKYSVSSPLMGTVSTHLVAVKENHTVHWSCYISISSLGIENTLLFEGTVNEEGTQGEWSFYIFAGAQEPFTRIEWHVESKNSISLTLTLLIDFGLNGSAGDTIKYTFDGMVNTLTIHRAKTDKTIIIAWNVNTKAGYIIAPNYNNGQKACWNANFLNTPCSEIEV